jgi:ABC-type sugar transport system permease subunit
MSNNQITARIQTLRPQIKRNRNPLNHKAKWAYIFISPIILFLLVFTLVPIFFSGWVSLHDWDLITPIPKMKWVGLDNYIYIFKNDIIFKTAFINTIKFAIFGVAINTILGLIGALLLNSGIRFTTFWRTIYFLPIVTAPMALGMMFASLMDKNFGLINTMLGLVGIPPQPFLSSPDQALGCIICIAVYQSLGYYIIIFLAGLQGIPQEYYDAASVDGANKFQTFQYITLPSLRPVMSFLIVTNTIGALQVFDIVYTATGSMSQSSGGPANSTMTIVLHMYNSAFQFFKMGNASAMAMVLFVLIMIITLFQLRLLRAQE